jgi:hypothetical protein
MARSAFFRCVLVFSQRREHRVKRRGYDREDSEMDIRGESRRGGWRGNPTVPAVISSAALQAQIHP